MKNIVLINKKIGETPLEALERARKENGIEPSIPMTYAGRLDPMAEGLLLILVGEECKKKEEYLNLDKEYEVEVLLGFETDTGDLLGKLQDTKPVSPISTEELKNALQSSVTTFLQKYPKYASKTLANDYSEDTWPHKEVTIYSCELIEQREIDSTKLLHYIETTIAKVMGDFRQPEITSAWKEALMTERSYPTIKIKVRCSSGTYMRVLASSIAQKLNTVGLAFSIQRTHIGEYIAK